MFLQAQHVSFLDKIRNYVVMTETSPLEKSVFQLALFLKPTSKKQKSGMSLVCSWGMPARLPVCPPSCSEYNNYRSKEAVRVF